MDAWTKEESCCVWGFFPASDSVPFAFLLPSPLTSSWPIPPLPYVVISASVLVTPLLLVGALFISFLRTKKVIEKIAGVVEWKRESSFYSKISRDKHRNDR